MVDSFRGSMRRATKQVSYVDLHNGLSDDEDFLDYTPSTKKKKEDIKEKISDVSSENKENEKKEIASCNQNGSKRRSPKQRMSVQERKFQRELEAALQLSIKSEEQIEVESDFQGFKKQPTPKVTEELTSKSPPMKAAVKLSQVVPEENVQELKPSTSIIKGDKVEALVVEEEPVPSTSTGFTGKRQRKKVNFVEDDDSDGNEWTENWTKHMLPEPEDEDSDFFPSPKKKKKKQETKKEKISSTKVEKNNKANSSTPKAGKETDKSSVMTALPKSLAGQEELDDQEWSVSKTENLQCSDDSDFSPSPKKKRRESKNLTLKIVKQKKIIKNEAKTEDDNRIVSPTQIKLSVIPKVGKMSNVPSNTSPCLENTTASKNLIQKERPNSSIINSKPVSTTVDPKSISTINNSKSVSTISNSKFISTINNSKSVSTTTSSKSIPNKTVDSTSGLKPFGLVKTPFKSPTIGSSHNILNSKPSSTGRIGLRLGLSRKGNVKPLHPNVLLK